MFKQIIYSYLIMIIFILEKISLLHCKKRIVFSTSIQATKSISLPDTTSFSSWFERPSTPLEILRLNPGIQTVEAKYSMPLSIENDNNHDHDHNHKPVNKSSLSAYLTPLTFPGLSVQSIVDFDTTFDGKTLKVLCNDNSTRQSFSGSKALASIVSRLTPTIRSSSTLFYDKNDAILYNSATLEIEFRVPQWFPFNTKVVEIEGSKVIEKTLSQDLQNLLNRIVAKYEENQKI